MALPSLTAYSITAVAASQAPVSWKLEGSSNGTSWKAIDQQTEAVFPYDNCTNAYRVNPGTSYLFYRLTISGEDAKLTQWQLFGKPDYGTYYADVTTIATIIASDGSDAELLIDDDGATFATVSGTDKYWDIAIPIPVKVLGFSLVCADDAQLDPQNFVLYGYEDDGTETQISAKELTFPARGTRLTYTITSTKLFKQFRLACTNANSSSVRLADFELYGAAIAEIDDPNLLAPSSVEATAAGLSNTELINRVYDGNRTTNYRAAFTEPVSITYQYEEGVSINAYAITANKSEVTRDPADWTLEGSNDGTTWTEIDSRTGETFSQRYATQFYSVEVAEPYSIYRLTVTATNGGNQIQIGEVQLLNIVPIDPDGIHSMFNEQYSIFNNEDAIYDLSGRRIDNSQFTIHNFSQSSGTGGTQLMRGIYIVNGKKLLVK